VGGAETTPTLRSTFVSTTGGVMTEEVGDITGELELQTRQTRATPDGSAVEAMVRYAGGKDLYTVLGSPVRTATLSERSGQVDNRATHERILETLTTPGRVESGNEKPIDLLED
jgi:hypothetical protein